MKLGDIITLRATPSLILAINGETEKFIKRLLEAGEVDLERECLAFARDIVIMLGEHDENKKEEPSPTKPDWPHRECDHYAHDPTPQQAREGVVSCYRPENSSGSCIPDYCPYGGPVVSKPKEEGGS